MSNEKIRDRLTVSDRDVIRGKVYRLVGPSFTVQDGEELEQDATLHLWLRLQRYKRSRGNRRAFVAKVVRNFIATRFKARKAKKRQPPTIRSLGGQGPRALANFIEPRHQDAVRRRHRPLDEAAATRLAVEVADILAGLPKPLRKLAALLMQGESFTNAAAVLGIHPGTARRWARRIGEALERES